jgi:hypothetical protein
MPQGWPSVLAKSGAATSHHQSPHASGFTYAFHPLPSSSLVSALSHVANPMRDVVALIDIRGEATAH